jgi:hypothetical protein
MRHASARIGGRTIFGCLDLEFVFCQSVRLARASAWRFDAAMPRDPFVREKFTRERTAAKKLAAEYFLRFPKDRYQTEVESWRELQSRNIEFTMKRLREPIGAVILKRPPTEAAYILSSLTISARCSSLFA